ncbi:hypothetical protein ACJMK2_037900 [Sinanodonta woodiana]|uniref:Seipin n=1 Tax=Sinanodonta woodiana TaxID=1069815 RepID=A0ABD3WLV6_SINWO
MLFFYLRTVDRILNLISWILSTLSNNIKLILSLIFLVSIILWLSVFSYGCFYYVYMPIVSFSTPVYFQFRVCDDGSGKCSFPSANISLYNDGQSVIFMSGQSYHVMLEMDVPESPVNQNLGMFMVRMMVYDRQGQEVKVSSRSAILQYRSQLLRILETFVFSPFLLTGYAKQKQIIPVELFSDYVDDAYRPAVTAIIEVRNTRVEIYSAELKVLAEFTGIRYLMYHWSITAAVVGIAFNIMVFSFITVLSWLGLSNKEIVSPTRDRAVLRRGRQDTRAPLRQERVARTETLGPDTAQSSVPGEPEETMLLTPHYPWLEDSTRHRQPYQQENVT